MNEQVYIACRLKLDQDIQNINDLISIKKDKIDANNHIWEVKHHKIFSKLTKFLWIATAVFGSIFGLLQFFKLLINVNQVLLAAVPFIITLGSATVIDKFKRTAEDFIDENKTLKRDIDDLNVKKRRKHEELLALEKEMITFLYSKSEKLDNQPAMTLNNVVPTNEQIESIEEKPKRRSLVNHPFDI